MINLKDLHPIEQELLGRIQIFKVRAYELGFNAGWGKNAAANPFQIDMLKLAYQSGFDAAQQDRPKKED